jgi:hypothetical protein
MAEAEVLRAAPAAVLLTAYYPDANPARRAEFVDCLARNAANEWLDAVHVFLEDGARPELIDPKLHLVEHGRRATYGDLFAYANAHLSGCRVAIANADIYFDASLARLEAVDLSETLLCVSRWDIHRDGTVSLFEHGESQDAWIFDSPIRKFLCDFPLGVPGCDNRLAWEAGAAGLAVHNPAR